MYGGALFLNCIILHNLKVRLWGSNKDNNLRRLDKLEKKFIAGKKKINSLQNELKICKESKGLIRNLIRTPVKTTKLGHKNG